MTYGAVSQEANLGLQWASVVTMTYGAGSQEANLDLQWTSVADVLASWALGRTTLIPKNAEPVDVGDFCPLMTTSLLLLSV